MHRDAFLYSRSNNMQKCLIALQFVLIHSLLPSKTCLFPDKYRKESLKGGSEKLYLLHDIRPSNYKTQGIVIQRR